MAGSVPTLWNQLDIRSKGSLARLRGLLVAHTGHLAAGARQSAGNHRSKIEGLGWLAVAAGAIFAVPSLQSLIAPLLGSEGLATASFGSRSQRLFDLETNAYVRFSRSLLQRCPTAIGQCQRDH